MYTSISQAIVAFLTPLIMAMLNCKGVRNIRLSQVMEILAAALFASGFWAIWSTCNLNGQSSQECIVAAVQTVVGFASWGALLYREHNHQH